MPKVIQVIENIENRGNGKDDPYRNIYVYYALDGRKLAEDDPYFKIEEAR
jgi:hypothetical protein